VWNHAYGRRTIKVPAYSLDDDAAFSDAELRAVIAVWRGVAEDYAAWDVSRRRAGGRGVGAGAR
jgi:hypothetical protein